MKYPFLLSVILLLTACQIQTDERLSFAFQYAGENSRELEKVLEYYRDDSLKREAAQYLITNMPGLKGYDRRLIKDLESVYEKHIRISQKYNWEKPQGWRNEIAEMWEREQPHIDLLKYPMIPDLQIIKAEWLIQEIELAFKAWQENAYTKEAPFEDFCMYILPYRFTDQFCLDNYRQLFYDRHQGFFSQKRDDFRKLTDSLHFKYSFLGHSVGYGASIPICDIATYERIRRGICRDQTQFNALLMSALGMPIAIDFTPAWGNRSDGHSWNALVMEGKTYPFEPFWDEERWKYDQIYNNESIDLVARKFRLPKVFRHTFELHIGDGPFFDKEEKKENVPGLFKNPRMKDVSSQYFKTTDVQVDITKRIPEDTHYCYLCVYNAISMDWTPVQWGKIKGKQATFKGMGRDIVYLPAFYVNGEIIPAAPAFRLEQDGSCRTLQPDGKKTDITVSTLSAIYSVRRDFLSGAQLVGCEDEGWQGEEEVLYTISDTIDTGCNSVELHPRKPYRYLRLFLPQDSIALNEIIFFERQGNQIRPVSDVKLYAKTQTTNRLKPEYMVDHLSGTGYLGAFCSEEEKRKGILFDLGKSCDLCGFSFVPLTNYRVNAGPSYSLCYWDRDQWIEAAVVEGENDFITFKQVPSGALYVVKSSMPVHDTFYRERIFTYTDGIQYWW